jgi:DNA-directed RNA polymerase specialized sigma24 family protein
MDFSIRYTEREYLILAKSIRDIDRRNNYSIDREDIEQELYIKWIEWIKEWEEYPAPKGLSLRSHLLRRSIWFLRDFIKGQAGAIDREQKIEEKKVIEINEPAEDITPLKWLTGYLAIENKLSSYSRYLLFMKDIQGLTIRELSDILGRHWTLVNQELTTARKELAKN